MKNLSYENFGILENLVYNKNYKIFRKIEHKMDFERGLICSKSVYQNIINFLYLAQEKYMKSA